MVAVDLRPLDVTADEVAMEIELAQEMRAEVRVRPGLAVAARMEQPRPGDDTQRRLHRDGPVDTASVRIPAQPVFDHVSRACRERFIACQYPCLAGREKPLCA